MAHPSSPIALIRLAGLLPLLLATAPSPAAISLSDTPLFLTVNVAPNLVISMDDSGSMAWGYIPDDIGDSTAKKNGPRFSAASYNGMYYNPKVTYSIPTRGDGVTYATSFTAAYVNGFDTSMGSTNLSSAGYQPITSCAPDTSFSSCSKATGLGSITDTDTETFTYTNCKAFFDDRGSKGNDRIYVKDCTPSMPSSGDGNPGDADGGKITVSGAGAYNGIYTLSSAKSTKNWDVLINLNSKTQIGSDSSNPLSGVSFTWTVTTTTTTKTGAYYHLYYSDKPGAAKPSGCNDSRETDACYILVAVGSADDIASGDAAAKKQNFANWYSFYRSRALAAMSAAMTAVTELQDGQVRLGWQTINDCKTFGTSCQGYDGVNRENRIRTLTSSHRTNFYNWLQRMDVNGGTPLRSTLKRAGDYYATSGKDSPYAQDPYVTLGTELSCRKNFHILFTDGSWNSDSGFDIGGNLDSSNKTLPDGQTYTPQYPYRNNPASPPSGYSYSNTLADVAFKYWYTDLRTDLANKVAPYVTDRSGTTSQQYWNPRNDPASWQHMVTFTIGLGLGAVLDDPAWGGSTYAGDYPDLASGTKFWPEVDETPSSGNEPPGHVYDLWHAAINSRGQFFSADNPQAASAAFKSALTSILNANPSAAALAANSTSLQTGTLVYQARFDSQDWHGQFIAFAVQGDGSIGAAQWDTADLIPAAASRNIHTHNGSNGVSFSNCSNLSSAQQAYLNKDAAGTVDNKCADRLAWLRGDTSKEARFSGGIFRNRTVSVLGDIINSDPAFVKSEDYGYGGSLVTLPEKSSYAAYLTAKASRTPMVYVGANDGMLHGVRADVGHANSGKEMFAYIPNAVFPNLSKLTATTYTHKFFVDGPPSVGDAYLSGTWKTILLGGLGGGGKSVYALDISSPDSFTASHVLWEYADATDLGYTYSQPQVARLHDGNWAAVFGNGYNSASDKAFLYIVNLSTGSLIAKLAAGASTGNGLSTPALYDADGDKIIDYVYAGDLLGNLWKFDLTSTSSALWAAANGGSPLFTARNASNQVQPITVQPKVGSHPTSGVLIYFGTGRYLTSADPNNLETQSFYAVWDSGASGTALRANLQAQSITAETSEYGYDVRETSANSVDWAGGKRGWYLDLLPPSGSAAGERVVSAALLKYGRVIFTTLIPSTDQCVPGGQSWLMELDAATGARTDGSSFDFNNDGEFDSTDKLASGNAASGVKSTVGIAKTPVWLDDANNPGIAYKQLSGTSGNIMTIKNKGDPNPPSGGGGGPVPTRVYWYQIL